MSAVTLETLRADFEAARQELIATAGRITIAEAEEMLFVLRDSPRTKWVTEPETVAIADPPGLLGQSDIPSFFAARLNARRYIIARDFNEFDPQRADMLWKLANGGAL